MTDSDAEMIASLKGFTPGPWQIFKSKYGGFVICERGYPVNNPDRPDGRGNIALIAAAPDLHRIATEQAAEIARLGNALAKERERCALIAEAWATNEQIIHGNGGPAAAIRMVKP